uniref:cytochrome c oxidase subunit 3 n=1 Tax=Drechslerella dactyloides TaxID=74499 RepID=UPI0022FD731B|nr:cytochrome c oxidase subunit 3 [Drechslerella dactyloides]WAN89813.1 cytochrome c oxidase subunit 3 [Drechslerella dactyloides]
MTNITRSNFQAHPFHLVSPSPWPLFTSISLLTLTTSGVVITKKKIKMTYLGHHSSAVQRGLNLGVALFITSEALFFLSVFWAFFHSILIFIMIEGWLINKEVLLISLDYYHIDFIYSCFTLLFELPLLNTVLIARNLVSVTYAHHSLIQGNRPGVLYGLIFTIVLAVVFTVCQGVEYTVSSFTLSDGSFGSCFYFGTGFHGLTVIIGTIFIAVGFWRILAYHSTDNHANKSDKLIMWVMFVDVVWLFLYVSVYYWGS